jgi:hypothetical protein
MASHEYQVSQNATFRPNRKSSLFGSQDCEIMRLLPIEDGGYLYRIICAVETFERVAKEGELSSRTTIHQTDHVFKT